MSDARDDHATADAILHEANVLVVDDDQSVRRVIARFLKISGAAVKEAASGSEALDALPLQRFDAILTDMTMADMDGIQLLKSVRQRDLDVAVILVTGASDLVGTLDLAALGIFECIAKPFRPGEFRRVVARAVTTTRLARAKPSHGDRGSGRA